MTTAFFGTIAVIVFASSVISVAFAQEGNKPLNLFESETFWLGVEVALVGAGTMGAFLWQAREYSRHERERLLELVQGYTRQLTELADKERNLKTKKDCETYAISYLDLMDQIAYLYKEKSIPKNIGNYFGNNFSYAMTILKWASEKILDDKPQTEETWTDLVEWCNDNKIEAFDDDAEYLPKSMQKYDDLPEEEVDEMRLIDLVKGYSHLLTDLTDKERNLKTKVDCEVYANNYLDTLDQIAYLYRQNAIPDEVAKYFENNFAYGMNLLGWINENIRDTPMKIETTWTDLKEWCDKNNIEAFEEEVLPRKMQSYSELPEQEEN